MDKPRADSKADIIRIYIDIIYPKIFSKYNELNKKKKNRVKNNNSRYSNKRTKLSLFNI